MNGEISFLFVGVAVVLLDDDGVGAGVDVDSCVEYILETPSEAAVELRLLLFLLISCGFPNVCPASC